MNFELSDELVELKNLATKFTKEEIIPVAAEYDRTGEYPIEIVKKAHKLGLMNILIPNEYGGLGLGSVAECVLSEACTYGCTGIASTLLVTNLGVSKNNGEIITIILVKYTVWLLSKHQC